MKRGYGVSAIGKAIAIVRRQDSNELKIVKTSKYLNGIKFDDVLAILGHLSQHLKDIHGKQCQWLEAGTDYQPPC